MNVMATTTQSARRINALASALKARNYLEIGVCAGHTFLDVRIDKRVAVDPEFRFDTKPHADANTVFHRMPSDQYFVNHAGEIFDLIFIDGLHTFEQTYRDFLSCLELSHRNTLFLIDDTVPSDVYSAWPSQQEAHQRRHEAGQRDDYSWHGDVYKVVFAIHDFHPLLSYATIMTGGNPQTLVWRRPRPEFAPRFNSLETISRLDWFHFKREFSLMNPKDEAAGLALAINALQRGD
jgi:hypothetical protein